MFDIMWYEGALYVLMWWEFHPLVLIQRDGTSVETKSYVF